ncbi:MAG TPA: peptidoglycan bridge formation glycyltransferase FemA/FemB family protein [Candidatus Saccharibacteria bacterium]|nr:peptidoglycan bridge formation glycyltransferase FemA/FemB family protein [Candidatus Saccharibacteria bacterium]HMR38754.1 peptidoglycan bridge formation glycyltransferase FemA/FemB family protein [Candidatus Saccharibacteria bacterium]
MHFLQSEPWETFQKQLGRTTYRQQGNGWHFLAILEKGKGNTRLYCPYGPEATDQASLDSAIAALKQLATQLKASFIRIEPTSFEFAQHLKNTGWQKVTYQSLNPEYTNTIDLSPESDQLIANMSSSIRNIYRNYHKKLVNIHQSNDPQDIDIFLKLIHQVSERTGLRPHSDEYFRAQAKSLMPTGAATLWYATVDTLPIASALFYDSVDTRYNAHAAASSLPEHRKLKAATALLAEAILDAKARGLTVFDMYGVAPIDAPSDHAWAGFSEFKRSFGGSDVHFAGSWDLPMQKLRYQAYRAYQKLSR